MDDQMNQNMGGAGAVLPPPPPPPPAGEDPHTKIMESLARIEEKLSAIAVKVGA